MIYYKIDVLKELKNKNMTIYRLQKDKIMGSSLITKLKNNNTDITIKNINRLCELLDMQPGDIIGYIPDQEQGAAEPHAAAGTVCTSET